MPLPAVAAAAVSVTNITAAAAAAATAAAAAAVAPAAAADTTAAAAADTTAAVAAVSVTVLTGRLHVNSGCRVGVGCLHGYSFGWWRYRIKRVAVGWFYPQREDGQWDRVPWSGGWSAD